jgi:hypothetical protein
MVRVLAIVPKVRGFKPGRGDGLLNAIKNPQHAFLRWGSKVIPQCRTVLQRVKKNHFEV